MQERTNHRIHARTNAIGTIEIMLAGRVLKEGDLLELRVEPCQTETRSPHRWIPVRYEFDQVQLTPSFTSGSHVYLGGGFAVRWSSSEEAA